jgi:hypothetical protein
VRLSDTIFKGRHPRTTPAKLGLIWCSGYREDLNVKAYNIRTPSDGISSHRIVIDLSIFSDKYYINSQSWTYKINDGNYIKNHLSM